MIQGHASTCSCPDIGRPALRIGSTTYVQVPDRFEGAVLTARRKAFETLATAVEAGGECGPEWKMTLLFEVMLLGCINEKNR